MSHEHPVGLARGRSPLLVDHPGRRLVEDGPTGAVQPPAEVHVLDVHEVSLVEAANRLEGVAPYEEARTRHPVRVAGPVLLVAEQAGTAASRGCRARTGRQSRARALRRGPGTSAPMGRPSRPSRAASGPPLPRPACASSASARRSMASGSVTRSGLQMNRSSRWLDLAPRFAPAPYPPLRGARISRHGTPRVRTRAVEPSVEPLSTTTMSVTPLRCRLATQRASTSPAL